MEALYTLDECRLASELLLLPSFLIEFCFRLFYFVACQISHSRIIVKQGWALGNLFNTRAISKNVLFIGGRTANNAANSPFNFIIYSNY